MILLDIESYAIPTYFSDEIRKAFQTPILVYLFHTEDERNFFPIFTFVDFKNGKIHYFDTFSERNKEKIETNPHQIIFKIEGQFTPHCVIEHKEKLIIFNENTAFFYVLNTNNKSVEIWTIFDIFEGLQHSNFFFCSTVFSLGKDSFIMGISNFEEQKEEWYKISFDFSSKEKILTYTTHGLPHTILPYKGMLYGSLFNESNVQKIGETQALRKKDWYTYVFRDLFQKYCQFIGENYCEESFHGAVQTLSNSCSLSPDFSYFLMHHYGTDDFIRICLQNEAYAFQGVPGKIITYDLKNKTLKEYQTSTASPAHFVIDSDNDILYVSNHNFFSHNQGKFLLGPAIIDKFQITHSGLEKIASFEHEEGYRFTTHLSFSYAGKSYIVASGQPNRIYFIDAENMELVYFDTIGEDILGKQQDMHRYIKSIPIEGKSIKNSILKCMQVSHKNGIVFILGYDFLYFYSFPQKNIIFQVPYKEDLEQKGKSDLYQRSTHCQFINFISL